MITLTAISHPSFIAKLKAASRKALKAKLKIADFETRNGRVTVQYNPEYKRFSVFHHTAKGPQCITLLAGYAIAPSAGGMPHSVAGYYCDSEATAKAFTELLRKVDGWPSDIYAAKDMRSLVACAPH